MDTLAMIDLDALARWWMVVAVDVGLKGLAILVAAAVAVALLRRRSASVRHAVWMLALGGLLVLPALALGLPGWRILPEWADTEAPALLVANPAAGETVRPMDTAPLPAVVTEGVPGDGVATRPVPAHVGPDAGSTDRTPRVAGQGAVRPPTTDVAAGTAAPVSAPVPVAKRIATWAAMIWAAGCVVCLLPLLLGRLSLWRIRRGAQPAGAAWGTMIEQAARQVSLKRHATVLVTARRTMPLVWGLVRPHLLLPAEAATWPAQRQRVVLLHELAHVRRNDCAAKLVARVACALYWFNPMAWMALRWMETEAEAACDDLVLAAGEKASDYAGHLLETVASLPCPRMSSPSSIALARPSRLEGRLLRILDAGRSRRRLTRLGAAVGVLVLVGLVVPVAALRARPADVPAKEPAAEAGLLLPGSRTTMESALGTAGRILVAGEALEDTSASQDEIGVGQAIQRFKVLERLEGAAGGEKEVEIRYTQLSLREAKERLVKKGERVLWVVQQEPTSPDRLVRWSGVKAWADTAENRQALVAAAKARPDRSWGEAVKGLQAGIEFKRMTPDPSPKALLLLQVRNVGDKPLRLLSLPAQARFWGQYLPLDVTVGNRVKDYQGPVNDPGPAPAESEYIYLVPGQISGVEVSMDPTLWKVADPAQATVAFVFANLSEVDDPGKPYARIEGLWTGTARSPRVPLASEPTGASSTAAPLPGSAVTDFRSYVAYPRSVVVVAEALAEPNPESLEQGLRTVGAQPFKIIEEIQRGSLGDEVPPYRRPSQVLVAYRFQSPAERPVAKGERVIWVLGYPAAGRLGIRTDEYIYLGLKALPDNSTARLTVTDLINAGRGMRVESWPVPTSQAMAGSTVSLDMAVAAEARSVALCEAVSDASVNEGAVGDLRTRQSFKVIEMLAGRRPAADVTVDYMQVTHSLIKERPIRKGDKVLWIARPQSTLVEETWCGVKALLDTPENRRLAVDSATRGADDMGRVLAALEKELGGAWKVRAARVDSPRDGTNVREMWFRGDNESLRFNPPGPKGEKFATFEIFLHLLWKPTDPPATQAAGNLLSQVMTETAAYRVYGGVIAPAEADRAAAEAAIRRALAAAHPYADQEGWGGPTDGIQTRLVPDKDTWRTGETVTFRVEARRDGKPLALSWGQDRDADYRCELRADTVYCLIKTRGDVIDRFALDTNCRDVARNEPLSLVPGKHVLRVGVYTNLSRETIQSNNVTIEVLPPGAATPAVTPSAASAGVLPAGAATSALTTPEAALALLKDFRWGEPVTPVAEVTLPGGVKAYTAVLRETSWEPNSMSQQQGLSAAGSNPEALPEAERLKTMRRSDDHVQVWLVPISAGQAGPGDALKAALKPTALPHRFHREPAYMGTGRGYAWYAYTPIYSWVDVQKRLPLEGGEDPMAALVRGIGIEDEGSCTRNSCEQRLGMAGAMAIPYIDKSLAADPRLGGSMARALGESKDPQVTPWLIRQAESVDAATARAAKTALVWRPRPEAAAAYVRWLEEDLARTSAADWNLGGARLLGACRAVKAPGYEKLLPRLLAAPRSLGEYREALVASRDLAGRPVPQAMLDAETQILTCGNAMGGEFDPAKVDAAVKVLLAGDPDVAAAFALGLALREDMKSQVQAVRNGGLTILKALPDGKGLRLATLILQTGKDEPEWARSALAKVVAALTGAPSESLTQTLEGADKKLYLGLYEQFRTRLMPAVQKGDKDELARLAAEFNNSIGRRLLLARVSQVASDGKVTTLLNQVLGRPLSQMVMIDYATSDAPHVTRVKDPGGDYVMIETNRLAGGKYLDGVYITLVLEPSAAAVEKPAPAAKAEDLAWGEAVGGLSLRLSPRNGNRPFHAGETITFDRQVRNLGTKAATVRYPDYPGRLPVVRDAEGRVVPVKRDWDGTSVPGPPVLVTVTVDPGATAAVGSFNLKLDSRPDETVYENHAFLKPGPYRVSQLYRFSEGAGATWSGELNSGDLPMTVEQAVPPVLPAKAETAGGLACTLTAVPATLKVGDEILIVAEIRNVSDKTITFYYPTDNAARLLVVRDGGGRAISADLTGISENGMRETPVRTLKPGEVFKASYSGKVAYRKDYAANPTVNPVLSLDFRSDLIRFDLVAPGRFTVALRLANDEQATSTLARLKVESPWRGTLSSNAAEFQVTAATRQELDAAIAATGKGEVEPRRQAIRLLAAHSDAKAVPALLDVLLNGPETLKSEAAAALQAIGNDAVTATVVSEYRKAGSPEQRQRLLGVMEASTDWRQQWPLYLEIAKTGPTLEEKHAAFYRLVDIGRPEVVPILLAAAHGDEPRSQWASIDSLRTILEWKKVPPETLAAITEDLLGILKNDKAGNVRSRAAQALEKAPSEKVVAALVAALKDEDAFTGSYAASTLGRIAGPDVIPALEAYLLSAPRDGQKDAARQAIESIRARAAMPKPAATSGAMGGLPATAPTENVRPGATDGLSASATASDPRPGAASTSSAAAESKLPDDQASLLKLAADPAYGMEGFRALLKLRDMGDAAAVPVLEKVLADHVGQTRIHGFAAAQALFRIGTPEAHAALAKYLSMPGFNRPLNLRYLWSWNTPPALRNAFIERYYLSSVGKDLAVSVQASQRKEAPAEIEFTVTMTNRSGRAMQLYDPDAYLGQMLLLRSADGTFVQSTQTVMKYHYRTPWDAEAYALLAPGAERRYTIKAWLVLQAADTFRQFLPEGGGAMLDCRDSAQFIGRLGKFQVRAMFYAAPMTPAQLDAVKFKADDVWSGYAVSEPVEVDLSAAAGATGGLTASAPLVGPASGAPVLVSPHTPMKSADPKAAAGQPSDGVRVTVSSEKPQWKAGETVRLKANLINEGGHTFLTGLSQACWEVQVDGRWYRWDGLVDMKSSELAPGQAYSDILITLNEPENHWIAKEGSEKLALAPGRHTVSVAPRCISPDRSVADAHPVSGPETFEILPEAGPAATRGATGGLPASASPDLAKKSDALLTEADRAVIEKEIADTFDQAVKEHNAAAQQLADVKPGAAVNPRDAKDFIPWGLALGSDPVGEVCLNRSETLATLFRRLGDPTSAAARPSSGDPAYAGRRLAYAEAAGRFLTNKDPKYVAVACEFLAHLPAEAVDAGLTPALAGLLSRRDAAFEGVTRGVTQQSDSLTRIAGGVTVGMLADAALAEMTSFHFADPSTFQVWWNRNQDYRNRLWYWSLRWRGVRRETADYARADVAALPPAQALRFMLLAGNTFAKLADAGVPVDAALGRLGTGPILEQRRYAPSFHGSIIADLVQRHGLKNDLMAVVRQDPPWPEAKGKEALRALFLSDDGSTTVLPIVMQPGLRASFDKADVDAIVKEVEDARGLLSNDQLLNQFVETVLMLDPSRAEGLCVSLLKRNPKQPLIAARLVRYSALQHWDLVQAACPPGADRRPVVEALGDLRTPEAAAILLRWMNVQDWTPKLNNLGYESDPAMGYLRESFAKAANAMNRGQPVIAKDLLDRATWRGSKSSPEELKAANKDVPAAQAELVAALKKFFAEAAGPAANDKVR
jgi:beta-lactamase regulating signal transducer with metallopeptidase domain/HEAT repeat protein